MSNGLVKVEYAEIPRIGSAAHLYAAAASLVAKNCAYIVETEVRSRGRPITEQHRQIGLLVSYLCDLPGAGLWISTPDGELYTNPTLDIGLRSLTYNPHQSSVSLIRWHHNTSGTLEITTAQAGPGYQSRTETNFRLASLLRYGMTDPELADPVTFRRGTIGPNESIVFRLNKGGSDGTPLLIDFRTTSPARSAQIHDIYPFAGSAGIVTF